MATKTDELIVLLRADIKGLEASLNTATQRISSFRRSTDNEMGALRTSFNRVATAAFALTAAFAAVRVGKAIVDAGMQMQALEARMLAATGSAQYAAASLQFVRDIAEWLGLDLITTGNGFASFAASGLRASLTFQEVKDIFTGVSEAATSLRLSGERVQLVFMALSQMASKGRVSMEELRQQLGESLPGAIQIFAKAMGVSNSAFIKMVENGQVTTRDLIKLGNAMRQEFGESAEQAAQGAQAAFNRFGNAFFELQAKLASSGFLDAIVNAVNRMTDALNDPGLVKGLSAFVSFLATVIELAARAAAMIGNLLMKIGEFEVRAAALVGIGPGVKDKPEAGKRKPVQIALNPNYSLGEMEVPGESDKQRAAREKAERQREQMRNRVEGIRNRNAGEFDPQRKAAMDHAEQQKELDKALKMKAISEQEYREASLEAELAYQEKLTDIRKNANDIELSMREKTLNSIAGLLNVFAGKNKAIAIAMLAFDKARAIAQAMMETHVAAAAALKYDPTGATSSYVTTLGYANVAAIAATGIAELATMGAGGGAASSGGGSADYSGGGSPSAAAAPAASSRIHVTLVGRDWTSFTKGDMRQLLDQFNDMGADGSTIELSLA